MITSLRRVDKTPVVPDTMLMCRFFSWVVLAACGPRLGKCLADTLASYGETARLRPLTQGDLRRSEARDYGRTRAAASHLWNTLAGALVTRCCGETPQPVVQGRSLPGLRTAQMRVIRSAGMSNANTVTVTPSCWATRPG